MEPGREDREHTKNAVVAGATQAAAMEPGREDREHADSTESTQRDIFPLQWNPAVKTGSTAHCNCPPDPWPRCNGTRP